MRASAAYGDRSICGGHRGENAATPTYIAVMNWFFDGIRQMFAVKDDTGAVTDRKALFWCTTEELRLMRMTNGTATQSFIRISDEESRPLDVKPADIEWALAISLELDRAKETEDRRDFAPALAMYEEILKKTGRSDFVLMRIGGCYANLGKPRQALLHLEKAADINPKNPQIRRWIDECRRLFPER
jgi:tetratricopeptide (TPR) repeat protein